MQRVSQRAWGNWRVQMVAEFAHLASERAPARRIGEGENSPRHWELSRITPSPSRARWHVIGGGGERPSSQIRETLQRGPRSFRYRRRR